MEFSEVIILSTLTVVFLFQIIILINQHKNAKIIREFIAHRAKSFQPDRGRHDRKDNISRQNRQNQQDFRSKQPQTPSLSAQAAGNTDNVEKSLREINLKLKNAERDQEAARRRIQENLGKDNSRRRNDNNRGSGGKDRPRDHHRNHRNRKKWHERNTQEKPYYGAGYPPDQSNREAPVAIAPTPALTEEPTTGQLPDLTPVDFNVDNTEHGRKFIVRRHPLKESIAGEGSADQEEIDRGETAAIQGGPDEPAPIVEETRNTEQSSNTEISFGRR